MPLKACCWLWNTTSIYKYNVYTAWNVSSRDICKRHVDSSVKKVGFLRLLNSPVTVSANKQIILFLIVNFNCQLVIKTPVCRLLNHWLLSLWFNIITTWQAWAIKRKGTSSLSCSGRASSNQLNNCYFTSASLRKWESTWLKPADLSCSKFSLLGAD